MTYYETKRRREAAARRANEEKRALEALLRDAHEALARVEALAKRARGATRDTENPGAATVWLASLEAALAGSSPEYHAGALYGIRHPGPRDGCPYCDETIAQRDRWAPSPDEGGTS